MTIKRRHIRMARAWRRSWGNNSKWPHYSREQWAIFGQMVRWYRAAKGRKA